MINSYNKIFIPERTRAKRANIGHRNSMPCLIRLNKFIVFLIINAKFQHQLAASGLFVPAVTVDLERPSVYVGLDKLPPDVAHAALPPTLDVFPPIFKPVDHIHKDLVFPDDEHARFTFNGRIAPGDHRILMTDHVSPS